MNRKVLFGADIKNIFLDVSVGGPFETAFEAWFEMSIGEYEVQFFDLINIYLNGS